MAEFISDLAAKAGIDAGMAQKGVGALLSTLQKYIPSEAYTKVAAVIPNAGGIVSAFQSAPAAPQAGGLDLTSVAVAAHANRGHGELSQRRHGSLGAVFLGEAEDGIEDDDDHNHDRVQRRADGQRDHGGHEEHDDHDLGELAQKDGEWTA